MRKYQILLVDDDPLILQSSALVLKENGYAIDTARSGEESLQRLAHQSFDLILTDLVMGGIDGLEVIRQAKENNPDIMAIILTGYGTLEAAIQALRLGADDFIIKPCGEAEIVYRISSCLEKREIRRRIKAYEEILPVCCVCKKIRDDSGREPGTGEWMELEHYMYERMSIKPTSTYCPECAAVEIKKLQS